VEVVLDGSTLGEPFANLAALKKGRLFSLPDGGSLWVQFRQQLGFAGVAVELNGRSLPGSQTDPVAQINVAAGLLWFVAGISALAGVLAMAGTRFLVDLGFGWPALVLGALFAVLGFFTWKYHSRIALGLGIILLCADGIATLILTTKGGHPALGGLVMRVFLVAALVRGFAAVSKAKG
jgi:hypothetical protein